jgi:hypothetical protein
MPTKHNLMVKVIDARAGEIQKILKQAGVQVVSVVEVHKEEIPEQKTEQPAAATKE